MYVYYDNTGTLKTQINHGDILRQGSDLNLTICFNPSYVDPQGYIKSTAPYNSGFTYYEKGTNGTFTQVLTNSQTDYNAGKYYEKVIITARIRLTNSSTPIGLQAISEDDFREELFLKNNDAEMTYALIPGDTYTMGTFTWRHLDPGYADITNIPGMLKIEITLTSVGNLQDSDNSGDYSSEEIIAAQQNVYVNGVINAFVEAVLGYGEGATIDGSSERYDELRNLYVGLVNEVNHYEDQMETVQDIIDDYEDGDLDGLSNFIVYGTMPNDPNFTYDWEPGQSWMGVSLAKRLNASMDAHELYPQDPNDYIWSLFVGKATPQQTTTNGTTVTHTLVDDVDYTYAGNTTAIQTLTINIPSTITHGFYSGVNVRNKNSALTTVQIINNAVSNFPLTIVLRGHKNNSGYENQQINTWQPNPNSSVLEFLFYCDGLDVKCHIMES